MANNEAALKGAVLPVLEGESQLHNGTAKLLTQSTRECDDVVYVPMTKADALGVGQSMRTLVRGRKLPPGTAAIYTRVAESMISEARIAIAQSKAGR
jgi:hypothetical protein